MQLSVKSQANARQISCKLQTNLRQVSCKSDGYLRQISGKSQAKLVQISGIQQANLSQNSNLRKLTRKSQENLRQLLGKIITNLIHSGKSCANLKNIASKSQGYLCISHTYLIRQISCIRHSYLHILDKYYSIRYFIYLFLRIYVRSSYLF